MHFCVIGDSWGGNYEFNTGVFEEVLSEHGHTVDNISERGASNQGQLRKLEYNYLGNKKTDYVIWVYTEPVRDFTEFVSLKFGDDVNAVKTTYPDLTYTDFYGDLSYIAQQDFRHAQRLYDTYNVPFIVVSGAGQIDASIDQFTFHRVPTVRTWTKELAQLDPMPINCYLEHVYWMIEWKNTYNRTQALEEISRLETLKSLMDRDRIRYEDGYHASREYYLPLIESILQHLKD